MHQRVVLCRTGLCARVCAPCALAAVDSVVCEVPKGSVLLLNNLIPHRSLANNSSNIRWSLDLRWQRPTEPNGFHGLKVPAAGARSCGGARAHTARAPCACASSRGWPCFGVCCSGE